MTPEQRNAEIAELAEYMVHGFWWDHYGVKGRKFYDEGPFYDDDGQMRLTYRFGDGFSEREEEIITKGLLSWEAPSGIEFVRIETAAQISFWKLDGFEDRASTIYDTRDRDGLFDNIHSDSVLFNQSNILLSDQALFERAAHEAGHTLGLGHPGNYNGTIGEPTHPADVRTNTIMSYDKNVPVSGPGPADWKAMELIYGPPPPTNTGDDVYKIDAPIFSFLKDDGGYDVAELSATDDSRIFDMRPGYGNNAVAVAEDTVIEEVMVMTPNITTAVIFEDRIEVHLAGWELEVDEDGWTLTFDNWSWGG